MNANYVSSFLHLDLKDDGVEDDIQYTIQYLISFYAKKYLCVDQKFHFFLIKTRKQCMKFWILKQS